MDAELMQRAGATAGRTEEKQEDENGTYACDVEGCGRSFESKQGLANHRTRTHGIKPKGRGGRSRRKTSSTPKAETQAVLNTAALIKMICPGGQAPAPMVPQIARWIGEGHEIFEACRKAGSKNGK
jgi:hypothetical protein